MKQTKLGFIYSNMRSHPAVFEESPKHLALVNKDSMSKLAASIVGVGFCLATEWKLEHHYLTVDRVKVAEGRLEIMLWMLENAPKTYHEIVRLSLSYDKRNAA